MRRRDFVAGAAALRGDWPIPPEVRRKLLQAAIDIVDPDHDEPAELPASDKPDTGKPEATPARKPSARLQLSALKVIAAFSKLSMVQERNDLAREKLELEKAKVPTTEGGAIDRDVIAEACLEAERRKAERASPEPAE